MRWWVAWRGDDSAHMVRRGRAWIEVVTSRDCSLCATLLGRLAVAAPFFVMRVTVTDVGSDPALGEEYRERVPVIRSARGRVLAEGDISWPGVVGALARGRFSLSGRGRVGGR